MSKFSTEFYREFASLLIESSDLGKEFKEEVLLDLLRLQTHLEEGDYEFLALVEKACEC